MNNTALDDYLDDIEPEFKTIARQVYELGSSLSKNVDTFTLYYEIFINLTCNIINIYRAEKPIEGLHKVAIPYEGDLNNDELKEYMKKVVNIVSSADQYIVDKSQYRDDLFFKYQEKILGTFILATGGDLSDFTEKNKCLHTRMKSQWN